LDSKLIGQAPSSDPVASELQPLEAEQYSTETVQLPQSSEDFPGAQHNERELPDDACDPISQSMSDGAAYSSNTANLESQYADTSQDVSSTTEPSALGIFPSPDLETTSSPATQDNALGSMMPATAANPVPVTELSSGVAPTVTLTDVPVSTTLFTHTSAALESEGGVLFTPIPSAELSPAPVLGVDDAGHGIDNINGADQDAMLQSPMIVDEDDLRPVEKLAREVTQVRDMIPVAHKVAQQPPVCANCNINSQLH
jgi:hypothetical protein